MKKFNMLLLSLLCLPVFAQLQKSVVYDFNAPTKLTPAVTPSVDNAGIVNVTRYVFTNGPVSISFMAGPQPVGAQIFTFIDDVHSQTSYSLRVTSTTTMTIAIDGGSVLDSIRISDDSTIGDLHLVTGEPGELDPYQMYKFWKSGVKNCDTVRFSVSSYPSLIRKMTVYYTAPAAVLQPTEVSPANGSTIDDFSSVKLTFEKEMRPKGEPVILLTKPDNSTEPLTAKCEGNVVTLMASSVIKVDGGYTITVPAGSFVNNEGFENEELTYSFTVKVPHNTLQYASVTPEQGEVRSLNDTITLTFNEAVKLAEGAKEVKLIKDGQEFAALQLSIDKDDNRKLLLVYDNENKDITRKGTYWLTISEGTILQAGDGSTEFNPAFDLAWTVNPVETETMKAAKALLTNTAYQGLGYPAADSDARTNLQKLTEDEDVPSDEELNTAIGAFYNETKVTLPTTGSFYKIAGVNAKDTKLYLACHNDSIVLTANAKEGTPFLLTHSSGNAYTVQTNSKYLKLLMPKASNISEAIQTLQLTKLSVAGVDSTKTLGKFAIVGAADGKDLSALLNYLNDNVNTSASKPLPLFTDEESSAFVLEEVKVTVAEVNCKLDTTQVENNREKLTLSFSGVKALTLEKDTASYIINSAGTKMATAAAKLLTPIDGTSFFVDLSGLEDATYTLVIPANTLLYTEDGVVKTPAEIKKTFTIKEEPKFKYQFDTYAFVQDVGVDAFVTDESLNDFILYIQIGLPHTGIVADESKTVRLAYYKDNSTIRTGHFVACSTKDFEDSYKKWHPGEDIPANTQAIKLVLDAPVKLGDLIAGKYSYVIEPGTFGDVNFGKYLKDKKSVAAEQCIVNRKVVLSQNVDNDKAIPKYPSAEVLAAAKELLKKTGLGYPSSTSSARKALQTLVDSGKGDDAQYTAAMQAFYEDSSVEKPAAGKYYTIAGVTSNNKVAYLQYDGTKVTLTTDVSKAAGFKAIVNNGAFTFKTGDGKYLHTLVNSNDYPGTTIANVSSDSSSVNRLLVNRLDNIIDVDAKNTMGLFSIYGSFSNNQGGFSLVNAATATILAPTTSLTSFTETNTNGFRFAEIDKAKIPAPAVKYTLDPVDKKELLSLKQVTVAFSYPNEVTIADRSKVTLKDASGKAVTIGGIALASGTKNKVVISFAELAPGTYTLNAAEGAFTYTFADVKKNIPAITATYTIAAKPELKYTFNPASGTSHESLSNVTLTITSPTGVTLKDASKITLVDANKKSLDILVNATGKEGEFNIAFNKLAAGTYTLTAAQGAFVYTLANTELEVAAMTASYTVEDAADIKWAISPEPGDYEAMNGLTLTFNSNKEIFLTDQSKVTLKNVLGMAVTLKEIKKDGNKFTISFDKLGTGPYTFEAAQGAFTYTFVGKTMQVEAITAKYTILAPPEVTVAVYPGTGTKFESLSSVKLTFTCSKPIELADESKVKLTDADGNAVELKNIENDSNVYTIEFDELPSGNYTFSFEKGAFVYTFGDEEIPVDGIEAVSYTVVPKPQVTWALNPEPDSSLESLSSVTLTLTADRTISLADKSKVTLTDEAGNAITLTDVAISQDVCTITFDEITTSGTYTLTAAQGAFTYQFGGKATPVDAITATYKVAEPRPSEVVLAEATELLKYVGLGYPTVDSEARKALSELVEKGRGTDEVFTKAMNDFYADTDVEMPAVDMYYHIVAITTTNDTAYVNQSGLLTGLVDSEAEATPLKLIAGKDGAYVLTTADGLVQLNVTISKKVNAEDAESVFGLFSINPFDEMKAIGFTFAEIDKADIPVPQIEFALTPESGSELDVLDEVKLTFNGYHKVDLDDATKIELVKGETTINPEVAAVEGSTNEYVLTFGIIDEPGTYALVVGEGAFTFDYADLTHEVDAIISNYVVKEPVPSDSVLAAAQELLKQSGVGYPAADSKSRADLEDLIAAGKGKDEVFEAAMAAFLAETDVEQPADGKF